MSDRLARLLHPAFLVALAVLVVNDHVLKAAFGNVLTGKLSDVAGLVVLPVLASSIFGWTSRRAVWAVHVAIGLAFAGLQFVPAEILQRVVPVQHTPDPTDLVALVVLPLGVWLARVEPRPLVAPRVRPALAHAVGLVAVGAVLATSPPLYLVEPIAGTSWRAEAPEQALERLERGFAALGLEARLCEPASYEAWREAQDWILASRVAPDDSVLAATYQRNVALWEERHAQGEASYLVPFGSAQSGLADDLAVYALWGPDDGRLTVEVFEGRGCDPQGNARTTAPRSDATRKAVRRAIERDVLDPLRETLER